MDKINRYLDNIIEYSLYVFIVTFPLTNLSGFLYSGTSTRFVSLVLLTTVLGLAMCVRWYRSGISISKSPIVYILFTHFTSLLISALVGINPDTSFWSVATRTTGIWYLINLGIYIYILTTVLSDTNRRNRLILLTIISTAVYSVLALLSPEGMGLIFKEYSTDAFTFGNSSFAGMYILGSFILSIYYLLQSEKKKWWMYILPILILLSPNTINGAIWLGDLNSGLLGEARASTYAIMLSPLLALIVWLVSMIKDVKSKIGISYTIYGISILILALSVFSLLSPGGYIRKIYLSQATEARPIVWEISQEAISQKPYFGWGTDNFERVFENSYDNRLLQDKYGNEAWFDRSHNVLIDQLVENGYIGLLSYILIYLVTAYVLIGVAIRSINRSERILACAILIYLPLHFLELQTAFDTTVSYPIFAFMIALALSLNTGESWRLNKITSYILASILSISLLYLFIFGFIPFVRAQNAYWNIRIVGSSEGRVREYKQLLASSVDKHAFLWKVTTDLQKGISQKPDILGDIDKYKSLKSELSVLESYHREYVQDHPNHFRAKLSLADILIYQRLFGVDMLTDAQIILDEAIEMSPQSPQPYWMKAVGYLYMRKFDLAREYANMGLKLNTDVTESKKVVKYIEESIKTFPNIDLYFFKQI